MNNKYFTLLVASYMCSKFHTLVQLSGVGVPHFYTSSASSYHPLLHTHCCSKFDRYGIWLLPHRTAHAKAYLGDFAGCWWASRGLILVFRCEMLGCAFDCCPFSSHNATRDRLSFHSAFLLLRPCLRQDNSPRWTTVSCELDNKSHLYHLYLCGKRYVSIHQRTNGNLGSFRLTAGQQVNQRHVC